MVKTIMLITDGFEEIEAVSIIDILRRADIQCDVCTVGYSEGNITGSHGIKIVENISLLDLEKDYYSDELSEYISGLYDAVVLPGGMPGSSKLRDSKDVIKIIQDFNKKNKTIAAICAAPKVLEKAGLLNGKTVTCYPGSLEDETSLINTGNPVECDGNIITGKAPGAAAEFSFEIIKALKDAATAEKIKTAMFYN